MVKGKKMKAYSDWQVLFCHDCYEPTPPGELTELFSGVYLCQECVDENLDNSELSDNFTGEI